MDVLRNLEPGRRAERNQRGLGKKESTLNIGAWGGRKSRPKVVTIEPSSSSGINSRSGDQRRKFVIKTKKLTFDQRITFSKIENFLVE